MSCTFLAYGIFVQFSRSDIAAHGLSDLLLLSAFMLLARVVIVLVVGVLATRIRTKSIYPRTGTHTWKS